MLVWGEGPRRRKARHKNKWLKSVNEDIKLLRIPHGRESPNIGGNGEK